ncbi:MAG: M1 family metallopeptidase [Alphaproteobacteria bacterium]|nr:M1 family metallopeptidase [Alphaproteobacteria bacterium]
MQLSRIFVLALSLTATLAQPEFASAQDRRGWQDKFRQLDEDWPTATDTRTASGAPGRAYWQQRVDYDIKVALDEAKRAISGRAVITYTNNSPETLKYLWLNLDQNQLAKNSDPVNARISDGDAKETYGAMRRTFAYEESTLGLMVTAVTDESGKPLPFTLVKTLVRIDLPTPLAPGGKTAFAVAWTADIPEITVHGTRGGYEHFEDDKNDLFQMSQWYPRLAAYSDSDGWHLRTFFANSEFTLEFGDFTVEITVPSDHIVAATGELRNAETVLTAEQRARLERARSAKKPVIVVSQEEATKAEAAKAKDTKSWIFHAENVRDFAWASSRKLIWDAQGHEVEPGRTVLAMSFYPKEGNPLWQQYSTAALIHSLDVYGRFTFAYPYPVIISVNGNVGGMEYPMLAFNSGRPDKDKKTGKLTYSSATKYGLISVIIHEAGHNWFPMIVNSDERRWTWMDEGLNTFLQFQAERLWEEGYPARRGEPKDIVDYMKSERRRPIMTDGESLENVGANAYALPATALNILRETIIGRELFDFAFKEYATRWKFKRANPADFFRTMEDASGVDLDWFWRGWFYGTERVDIALNGVTEYAIDTKNPEVEQPLARRRDGDEPQSLTEERNLEEARRDPSLRMRVDRQPDLKDFYNENDRFTVSNADRNKYNALIKDLKPWEKELLGRGEYAYMLDIANIGGLPMPVIVESTTADGDRDVIRIPPEVWRQDPGKFSKLIVSKEKIVSFAIDPRRETADADTENNFWPRRIEPSRLELFKQERPTGRNLMKDMDEKLKTSDDKKDGDKKDDDKDETD